MDSQWPTLLQAARHETTVTNVQRRLRMCPLPSHSFNFQCCHADPAIFSFNFCQALLQLRHSRIEEAMTTLMLRIQCRWLARQLNRRTYHCDTSNLGHSIEGHHM